MRSNKLGIKRLTVKRICYACGSGKTSKNRRAYDIWYLNHDTEEDNNVLCHRCYNRKYYQAHEEHMKKYKKEYNRQYYQKHKDQLKIKRKQQHSISNNNKMKEK
jgi:hypothetical protein